MLEKNKRISEYIYSLDYSKILLMLLCINILNIMDIASTNLGLTLGATEINYIPNIFFKYGLDEILNLFKITIMFLTSLVLYYAFMYHKQVNNIDNAFTDLVTIILMYSLYFAVVFNNSIHIIRLAL